MKHGEQRQQPFQKPKTIFGENALTLLPWQVDKQRFDIFSTEIKRICGETFIETSSPVDDIHHATDLKVYQISPLNIACRIRGFEYFDRYNGEFTIRSSRISGSKTELEKIMSGWGDYLFYGFSDKTGEKLVSWMIGDLNVFRNVWYNVLSGGKSTTADWHINHNVDKSSSFIIFKARSFPPDFITREEGFLANKDY